MWIPYSFSTMERTSTNETSVHSASRLSFTSLLSVVRFLCCDAYTLKSFSLHICSIFASIFLKMTLRMTENMAREIWRQIWQETPPEILHVAGVFLPPYLPPYLFPAIAHLSLSTLYPSLHLHPPATMPWCIIHGTTTLSPALSLLQAPLIIITSLASHII